MVFGEISWEGDSQLAGDPVLSSGWPKDQDETNVGNTLFSHWYMGAIVRMDGNNRSDIVGIHSSYTKVVTPFDYGVTATAGNKKNVGGTAQIINAGKAAKAKKETGRAATYRRFSNAGSWGSNHTGSMLAGFGDGRVQTLTETANTAVLCNLAATDATVTQSL